MKLVEVVVDDVTVLEVHGRIDSTTAKQLSDRLRALVQASQNGLRLDLEHIAYISSAGFRVLLVANRAAAEKRTKLAICGVIGEVKRLFDLGDFTGRFLICQTQ